MNSNLSRYKADLQRLSELGSDMRFDLELRHIADDRKLSKEEQELAKKLNGAFERDYQKWYTEAFAVIRQLVPDRISEFEHLYKGEGKRREINAVTYNVQDWLNGVRAGINTYTSQKSYNDFAVVTMRFKTQLAILDATGQRFESALFDIKQLVQADLFDSEVDSARELIRHGFLRGAGAIAGVVFEKHLAQVATNHSLTVRKQHPTISDLNDALKNAGVIELAVWRSIQRLGDLRNLADHNKNRDPTAEEMAELVDGASKVTKTLF